MTILIRKKKKPWTIKKATAKKEKKISKPQEVLDIEINGEENKVTKDKYSNKINEIEEVVFTDKKDEIELTDEINNTRKKRRRSSASIE